ncbi:heavy metal translocating P-type ATPase [Anaerotruncus sp. DFI.9.16]|uniref:heavy metal translocating P-type ATPase n=1 Tax=Anaerotruncus sp. DFI.9.16 TaxID=2965275 RepID=UPI00210E87DA|nr:heavy metal translocating P-type ATPase [Anaerotruncus sp. DFI.9.16]MCQ4894774.1 heavy metal translocating P-type ATPase [Anaerotruncus sp. DFI.9.16]
MKQKFDVTGMTCSACSAHVEKSVAKVPGVRSVTVNLLSNNMAVDYDETASSDAAVIHAVEEAGYGASVHAGAASSRPQAKAAPAADPMAAEIANMKRRLIVSFVFLIPLFYISMGHMMGLPLPHFLHGTANALVFAFTQLLLTLPIAYVNRKYYQVGFKTLFKGAPNMDSLIAIGSAAAMIYGVVAIYMIGWGLGHGDTALVEQYSMDLYFESAGMILALITLGKFLETRSKGKTGEAITKLMDLAPKTALVEREGVEAEIPVEEVAVGDLLIVKPGASIPVDGEITEGSAAVDESAITGESIPVDKGPGDRVIAATINRSGYFKFRATKVGADTTLAQIVALVEDAANSKAPIAKLADKVSGVFVPVVICIAVIAAVTWLLLGHTVEFALSIGIAVLVISCPCALGLATPVAIMVGTGKGAENGILIKSAEALETAHTIDTVVLDKTGTITEGKPRVTDIRTADGLSETELLTIAASVEKPSEHPLSTAIVEEAARRNLSLRAVTGFEAVAGQGVAAEAGGVRYLAGNRKMMEENRIELGDFAEKGETLSGEGKTPLYFAGEGKALGVVAVADTVKPTSRAAIEAFGQMGVDVVMLTGDNKRTAAAIQKQLGIGRVVAEVLPQDKEREVAKLQEQGRKVAMVGDGINDAPALTRADVGIAIGAGTDVAIESADVVLMKSDLLDAVTAIDLSRAVIRNIKQNLFWAFFYNSIGIPLAAGVFFSVLGWKLNPMFGAAAMSLSSVCVVSNALRLKLFQPRRAAASNTNSNQREKINQKEEIISMKKTMVIEGMSCGHCSARVEKALNALDGVTAKVDLEAKTASIETEGRVSDEQMKAAVTDAGYDVVSLS